MSVVEDSWKSYIAMLRMSPPVTGGSKFCLQLTNWRRLLCLLARGQISSRPKITQGEERVVWNAGDSCVSVLRSFWHPSHICYWCSSSIYARVGYIAPVAFQGLFSSSEVSFFPAAFIFCSLPLPPRDKALRMANSPFPHLTSVCCREERQL